MRATKLIAAAAMAFGTAAIAQQQENAATRGETTANTDAAKPADDAPRTKNALKNLGQKTRNAMHRAGDKMRGIAHNDKDRDHDKHARAEEHREKHARADMHHRHNDTRAMGARGSDTRDTRETEATRRQRMDDAYANWKSKQ